MSLFLFLADICLDFALSQGSLPGLTDQFSLLFRGFLLGFPVSPPCKAALHVFRGLQGQSKGLRVLFVDSATSLQKLIGLVEVTTHGLSYSALLPFRDQANRGLPGNVTRKVPLRETALSGGLARFQGDSPRPRGLCGHHVAGLSLHVVVAVSCLHFAGVFGCLSWFSIEKACELTTAVTAIGRFLLDFNLFQTLLIGVVVRFTGQLNFKSGLSQKNKQMG